MNQALSKSQAFSPTSWVSGRQPLQDVTDCLPHACLTPASGHLVALPGDSCLHSHLPVFSSFCCWLGWLVAAISQDIRPDLSPSLAMSLLEVALPGPIMQWAGPAGWFWLVLVCPGLRRGPLTALEMKGIQATLIGHLLCPSWEGPGHSEMSQPWS